MEVGRTVQELMQEDHGAQPVLSLGEDGLFVPFLSLLCLEMKQAGDDLEIVFHPVMHLAQ